LTYLIELLNSFSFRSIIWLIPIIMLLHELEEWNILEWYKKNYIDLPMSTKQSIRIWLLGISFVGFIWTAIAYLIPNPAIAAFFIILFIAFTLQNGLQHLYWLLYFKTYSPGFVFSFLLGIPVNVYICYRILEENLLPVWTIIVVNLFIIPGLVETVKAKNRMTKSIRGAHELGIRIVSRLWEKD